MDGEPGRIILVDTCDETREVLARRLRAQGYAVDPVSDAATGADRALSAPPAALIADLWMPSISGVQLCRLLRAEPATADVPVILRGEHDDPRSRFWAERAGAAAFVAKGRMGDLVRALSRAVAARPADDGFFMQLSGGSVDIRDRIARHLDAALFDSVIAAEVRALANCGSFDRLFDLFSQFLSQVISYRWLAMSTLSPAHFAVHHRPGIGPEAEQAARAALGLTADRPALHVEDDDARADGGEAAPMVRKVLFGNIQVGTVALCTNESSEGDAAELLSLVAREIGGAVRMAALVEESQRLAAIDPLTGLMNRRAFMTSMTVEMSRAERYGLPLSVLLFDVDHFKHINDQRGHATGDQVLADLGALLREQLRTPDIAARWGGEEFVVALTSTDEAGGLVVGERIRQAVEARGLCDRSGVRIPVTISVGLTTLMPNDTCDPLIDRADRAMYAAKTGGRNRLVVAPREALPTSVPAAPPAARAADLS